MRRAFRIVVDPIACCGEGLCAELFPERISLDPWGFPILSDEPITADLVEHAGRAVDMCPHLALHVMDAPANAGTGGGRPGEPARLVARLAPGGRRR